MKLHIELTKEQADELFAEATDGMDDRSREVCRSTAYRELVRAAIQQRLPA